MFIVKQKNLLRLFQENILRLLFQDHLFVLTAQAFAIRVSVGLSLQEYWHK